MKDSMESAASNSQQLNVVISDVRVIEKNEKRNSSAIVKTPVRRSPRLNKPETVFLRRSQRLAARI